MVSNSRILVDRLRYCLSTSCKRVAMEARKGGIVVVADDEDEDGSTADDDDDDD